MKDGIAFTEFEARLQELNELTQEKVENPRPRESYELGSFISVDDDVFYTPIPEDTNENEIKSTEIVIVQDF